MAKQFLKIKSGMSYIFLDESGDLGFDSSKNNSDYFIVTFIFIQNKKVLEKIVKKVHATLRKKIKGFSGGVLHSTKEKPVTRKRLLKLLVKENLKIMVVYLNKSKVYTKLQNEKHVLYNYVVNILLDRIMSRKLINCTEKIFMIASRRETNKFLNSNFKTYLVGQVKNKHKLEIQVEIKTPGQEKSLQIVDFVCWAIFNKYEHKRSDYYKTIKKLIVEERGLFG